MADESSKYIPQDIILSVLGVIQQKCTKDNNYLYSTVISIPTTDGWKPFKLTINQYEVDERGNAKKTILTIREE